MSCLNGLLQGNQQLVVKDSKSIDILWARLYTSENDLSDCNYTCPMPINMKQSPKEAHWVVWTMGLVVLFLLLPGSHHKGAGMTGNFYSLSLLEIPWF